MTKYLHFSRKNLSSFAKFLSLITLVVGTDFVSVTSSTDGLPCLPSGRWSSTRRDTNVEKAPNSTSKISYAVASYTLVVNSDS